MQQVNILKVFLILSNVNVRYTVMKYYIIIIYSICWKIAFELSCFVHFIWETVLIPLVMGSSSGINLGLHHIGILSVIWYFTQNTTFLRLPVFGGVRLEPLHWLRIVLSIGIIYPSEPPVLAQVLMCICWGSWNLKQRYFCLSVGVTPDGCFVFGGPCLSINNFKPTVRI